MLAMGGTGQQREDVDNVWLFVPNLIGYFRIVALVVAFFVAEPSPLAFLVRARRWATWPGSSYLNGKAYSQLVHFAQA